MNRAVSATVQQALLIVLSLVSLYPMWFTVQTALKSTQSYALNPVGLPSAPTLSNFAGLFKAMPFGLWMLNSLTVAIASVVASTIISVFAAYAIVFGRFAGRQFFLNVNIALMALPPVALIVPLFTLMLQVGLINTLSSVVIVYTGLMVPFSVFFFVNFFRELPIEVIEAATMDGASQSLILLRIVMPLSLSTTFTLITVNSIWVWNELLFALVFLQNNNNRTVMAGMALFQGRYSTNEPLMMSGALLSVLPLLVLYIASQKFFVRGMTAGIGK